MGRRIVFSVLSICVFFLQATANGKPTVCPKGRTLDVLLKEAGVASEDIAGYLKVFQQQRIDASVLKQMTTQQLQKTGIAAFGDATKIAKFFGQDSTDNCAALTNPCNKGSCHDGYKCFTCQCDPALGFHGPKCNQKCPCRNGGRCKTTLFGSECDCQPGFSGQLCESRWLTEARFTALEQKSQELLVKLEATENTLQKQEQDLKEQKQEITQLQTALNRSSGFSLKRVDKVFPSLARVALHQKTPTYIDQMPVDLPANTKAVMISVFCNFWNKGGHAYLNFDAYQKGNEKAGKISVTNRHYNIYANTLYYELLAPWDSQYSDEMVFKITSTYQTGGSNNWYQVKLVGYITA